MGNQSGVQLQGTFNLSETSTAAEVQGSTPAEAPTAAEGSQSSTDTLAELARAELARRATTHGQWMIVPPAQSLPLGQAAPAASPKGKGKSKGPSPLPPTAAKAPSPAPAAAKAKGKGGAPPPPPAPKGKGGAPAPAKAKGKGAPPPPKAKGMGKSAPSGNGNGKGKGKGVPVPTHLQAPGPQRLQLLTPYADGSIWESLQPWQADSPAVLQELQINFAALLDQWTVAPVQAVVLAQDDVFFGFRSAFQHLQILCRSLRLTPELVRRGLCEDLDLLSLEQAEALCWMEDLLGEVRGFLHAHVQRVGAADLEPSMALLLAVDSVPMWARLATFAKTRHTHADTMAFCLKPCADLENLVEKLGSSRPLRTVLQACLVATNVLSQSGESRLRPEDLKGLCGRKIHSNGTSVLTLVARDLEATHESRCRLRFLRMLAVGKAPVSSHFKKLVWVYLDDLQESPWDAVAVLKSCNVPIGNVENLCLVEKRGLARVLGSIQAYQGHANPASTHLGDRYAQPLVVNQQLRDLAVSLQQGMDNLDGCQERFTTSAKTVVSLFGRNARVHLRDSAAETLRDLYHFGINLEREMQALASAKKRGLEWQRTGQWGHWRAVETDTIVLHWTRDPDLVRQMRSPSQHQPEAIPLARAAPEAVADKEGPEMQHVHLLHGGPDGEYQRCEATGKWVPIGYAAAVAERDRGDRGATAGFFVTF